MSEQSRFELTTQNRVIALFTDKARLDCFCNDYLGGEYSSYDFLRQRSANCLYPVETLGGQIDAIHQPGKTTARIG